MFLGQERDPVPVIKPKVEPEDILDIDDYSSTERRKSCESFSFLILFIRSALPKGNLEYYDLGCFSETQLPIPLRLGIEFPRSSFDSAYLFTQMAIN